VRKKRRESEREKEKRVRERERERGLQKKICLELKTRLSSLPPQLKLDSRLFFKLKTFLEIN